MYLHGVAIRERAVEAGNFLKGVLGKAKSLKGKEET